jgi:hypothetical protein
MNELAQATVRPPGTQQMPQPGQELAPPALPTPIDLVAAGQQPAVLLPPVQPNAPLDPAQEFVIENFNALPELNLGAFEAQDLSTVIFNASLLTQEQLAEADSNGTLAALLEASTPMQAGGPAAAGAPAQIAADAAAQRPQMQVQTAPAAPAMPAPKVPAGTQDMLARARVRNMGAGPRSPGLTPNPLAGAVAGRPV